MHFFEGMAGYPWYTLASLRHRIFSGDSTPVSPVEQALMGQKVKISARGIYGNSKMIRHFSDSQLPSNAKETQKFKLPCDRERWTTAIVCNPRRKVIVGVGTSAVLTPSWFRCLVDDAGWV